MTILVIDDLPGNRTLLKHVLEASGFRNVLLAGSASEGFAALGMDESANGACNADLVLMDIMMPEIDGVEACRRVKASSTCADIPVMMVTALDDIENLEEAFDAGAVDYVSKPINQTELCSRVRSALTLKRAMDQRKSRELQLKKREGELLEVTRLLEESNERLRHLSTLDGLTGIPNRGRVMEFLAQEWRRSVRDRSWLSALMIDIDFYKNYNDSRGHQAGDDCLWMVANCLKRTLHRPADLVGRYGGEEFMAVLPDTPIEGAINVAEQMRASVEELKIDHPDSAVSRYVTVSVGVASCLPRGNMTSPELIGAADKALYRAKDQGRNRVVTAEPIGALGNGLGGANAPAADHERDDA